MPAGACQPESIADRHAIITLQTVVRLLAVLEGSLRELAGSWRGFASRGRDRQRLLNPSDAFGDGRASIDVW